jgi:1-acyl-sn-glycerol-3-phosphate acyltransferase
MLAFAWSFGLRPRFMMKHSVFVGPAGWLFRQLGGIPIERSRRYGVVKQMADVFAGAEDLMLLVPPEGTRARTPHWKSGFYHIAREARVPIALTYLDYRRRAAGFGPAFLLTDDMGFDMDRVRAFYADKSGLHPELSGPIRLEEEPEDALLALPQGDDGP